MQPWQYKRGTANLNMGLRGMKLNCYTSGPVSWALASVPVIVELADAI